MTSARSAYLITLTSAAGPASCPAAGVAASTHTNQYILRMANFLVHGPIPRGSQAAPLLIVSGPSRGRQEVLSFPPPGAALQSTRRGERREVRQPAGVPSGGTHHATVEWAIWACGDV